MKVIVGLVIALWLTGGLALAAQSRFTPPWTAVRWDGAGFEVVQSIRTRAGLEETEAQGRLAAHGQLFTFLKSGHTLYAYVGGSTGGKPIWQTEPEWQVDQFAIFDADGDGEEEVVFSLWKPDSAGAMRSHPFIYGVSKGQIRAEWCGSALSDPIQRFAFADLDGDGTQEMIVLEGVYGEPVRLRRTPARFVTVWRWNGWGFTNLWRSEPGRYSGLDIADFDGDGYPDVLVGTAELGG